MKKTFESKRAVGKCCTVYPSGSAKLNSFHHSHLALLKFSEIDSKSCTCFRCTRKRLFNETMPNLNRVRFELNNFFIFLNEKSKIEIVVEISLQLFGDARKYPNKTVRNKLQSRVLTSFLNGGVNERQHSEAELFLHELMVRSFSFFTRFFTLDRSFYLRYYFLSSIK